MATHDEQPPQIHSPNQHAQRPKGKHRPWDAARHNRYACSSNVPLQASSRTRTHINYHHPTLKYLKVLRTPLRLVSLTSIKTLLLSPTPIHPGRHYLINHPRRSSFFITHLQMPDPVGIQVTRAGRHHVGIPKPPMKWILTITRQSCDGMRRIST